MPMTMEYIRNLRNEVNTCEVFMIPLVRESEELDALAKERPLTLVERLRVQELADIIHAKNVWLVKAKKDIAKFFTPKTAA